MPHVEVNKGLTWNEVGNIPTGEGKCVRHAFWNELADKVLLPPNTTLYKFNGYSTLHASDPAAQYRPVSPWWSPFLPFRHDPGWEEKKKIARHFGVSVREWGRITSAVREDWNSLQYLLVIKLKHHVWCFFGGFAAQDRIGSGSSKRVTTGVGVMPEGRGQGTKLAGGGTQFYIPNLRPANIASWRVESVLGI